MVKKGTRERQRSLLLPASKVTLDPMLDLNKVSLHHKANDEQIKGKIDDGEGKQRVKLVPRSQAACKHLKTVYLKKSVLTN